MSAAKQLKTIREIESFIWEELELPTISRLQVRPDRALGWTVAVFADPRFVLGCQARADEIADELCQHFELKPAASSTE